MTNLPVMPERINQTSQSPAVSLSDGEDLGGPRLQRLREDSIRIGDGQDHSHRTATQRRVAEVAVLRILVTQPNLRAVHVSPCHHAPAGAFQTKDLNGSEC